MPPTLPTLPTFRRQSVADKLGARVTSERPPTVFSPAANSTLRRSQIQCLSTSLVYLACRQEGCGRSLEEASHASGVDKSALSKMQSGLSKDLKLPPTRVAPADLIGRIATQGRLGPATCTHARHVCQVLAKYDLCQAQAPQLVAGAVLLLVGLVCREPVNVSCLAEGTLSCSTAQLRKMYAQLRPHSALLLPAELCETFGDLALLPASLNNFPDLIPPLPLTRVKRERDGKNKGSAMAKTRGAASL